LFFAPDDESESSESSVSDLSDLSDVAVLVDFPLATAEEVPDPAGFEVDEVVAAPVLVFHPDPPRDMPCDMPWSMQSWIRSMISWLRSDQFCARTVESVWLPED
jgi:hypothetical protein